jgi:hypothetical protein
MPWRTPPRRANLASLEGEVGVILLNHLAKANVVQLRRVAAHFPGKRYARLAALIVQRRHRSDELSVSLKSTVASALLKFGFDPG